MNQVSSEDIVETKPNLQTLKEFQTQYIIQYGDESQTTDWSAASLISIHQVPKDEAAQDTLSQSL